MGDDELKKLDDEREFSKRRIKSHGFWCLSPHAMLVWHAILGICSPESEHGFQQQMMGMDSTHFSYWIQKHPVPACNVVALNQKH